MRHESITMTYDPETKIQSMPWKHKGSPTPKKFKVLPSEGKVLLSVFWNTQGVVMVDYLQRGATITGLYYAHLIHKFRDAIKERRRGKSRLKSFFIKTTPQVTSP